MKPKSCQKLADSKAFKGKGQAWQMLQGVGEELRAVWREMEILAHESGTKQAPAYVQVHRLPGLSQSGAVNELRWRLRQRQLDSHVLWHQVEPLLVNQAIGVRRYFWHLNQRMIDLNCQSGILKSIATRLLARMEDKARATGSSHLFVAWVKNELTLADFDLSQPAFTSTVRTQ